MGTDKTSVYDREAVGLGRGEHLQHLSESPVRSSILNTPRPPEFVCANAYRDTKTTLCMPFCVKRTLRKRIRGVLHLEEA